MQFALRRRAARACLALVVALAFHAPVSPAQQPQGAEGLTQDEAVALVRARSEGKVVRVDWKEDGGNLVYRIRVLTPDGRLREYRVNAATGEIR